MNIQLLRDNYENMTDKRISFLYKNILYFPDAPLINVFYVKTSDRHIQLIINHETVSCIVEINIIVNIFNRGY